VAVGRSGSSQFNFLKEIGLVRVRSGSDQFICLFFLDLRLIPIAGHLISSQVKFGSVQFDFFKKIKSGQILTS
jgi:hypothetical protein